MVEGDRNSQLENFLREAFWNENNGIHNSSGSRSQHPFPLARIRRIAKSTGKVERIGADATILMAKACEFFIIELTSRAWFNKQEKKRLTLQACDIERALNSNNWENFLARIVGANPQKEQMEFLKETMFHPAYPLQLQNLNPPEELNFLKETDPHFGNPMLSLSMNPSYLLGNQELPHMFLPSTSSVPLNYHPGSKAYLLENQEIPHMFLPSTSSVPLNYRPGSKAYLLENQEIPHMFLPSTSSVPLNYHPGSKAYLLENQEIPHMFLPSTSSVPLNYHPGSKAYLLENQDIPHMFLPSTSSVPSNYHPGSKAYLLENQDIPHMFLPSTSSVPLNYHPGSKEDPSERNCQMNSRFA